MNRIVLIGNGFDLAHGLPTRYEDFINWYWWQKLHSFFNNNSNISADSLVTFEIPQPYKWSEYAFRLRLFPKKMSTKDVIQSIINNPIKFKTTFSPFWKNIHNSVEIKGWVDIENEYYNLLTMYSMENISMGKLKRLNNQLQYLTEKLVQYLTLLGTHKQSRIDRIWDIIYSPIKSQDVSVEGEYLMQEHINYWMNEDENVLKEKMRRYGISDWVKCLIDIDHYKRNRELSIETPNLFRLPDNILLLSFNYTDTSRLYINKQVSHNIQIHGELNNPKSIIFGYGDEMDDNYKTLQKLNNNECLKNIKSIRYLESDSYRKVLSFIESSPYQIFIMGHSCGNSDRTLLNTLFEHKNCISIKPYYHKKENGNNYLDIVQNISRNFKDLKLMRDRVVNEMYCEPLK